MTKILIDLATVQQALVTLENVNPSLVCEMAHHPKKDQHGIGQKCPLELRHLETIAAIKEVLAQPVQPVQKFVEHTVIAGALFDFMGYLTSRKRRIVLSAADEASPAVDAINDFAKMRGLSLGDAQVLDWQDYTTPRLPVQRQPLREKLLLAAKMATECSYMDHGRRTINEQAWKKLIQAIARVNSPAPPPEADTAAQRKPLTDDVLVPLEILEAAANSLDSFCGNLGWGDEDLQNMDNLFAVIKQHKAAYGIKEKTCLT